MIRAFALELRGRHVAGESVEQLSAELGISVERIEQRLKAAAAYVERQAKELSEIVSRVRPLVRAAGSGSKIDGDSVPGSEI